MDFCFWYFGLCFHFCSLFPIKRPFYYRCLWLAFVDIFHCRYFFSLNYFRALSFIRNLILLFSFYVMFTGKKKRKKKTLSFYWLIFTLFQVFISVQRFELIRNTRPGLCFMFRLLWRVLSPFLRSQSLYKVSLILLCEIFSISMLVSNCNRVLIHYEHFIGFSVV